MSDWDKENIIDYASVIAGGCALAGIGQALQGASGIGQAFQTIRGVLSAVSTISSGVSLMQGITKMAEGFGASDVIVNNNLEVSNHVSNQTYFDGLNSEPSLSSSSSETNLGSIRTEPGNRKGIWIADLAKIGSDGFALSVNYKAGMLTYEDGRSYVSGTSTYIDKVFHDLEELRNSDCDFLTSRLKVLENSEFEHLIRYDSRYDTEVDGWEKDDFADNSKSRRWIRCGSKVNYDPNFRLEPDDPDNLQTVQHASVFLAHELLGHSYDYEMGTLRHNIKTKNGISYKEVDAVNIENVARGVLGDRKRLKYSNKEIPIELLWDTH
ncbi:MAG: hypothetical protein K1X54_11030 [Flavobacteriales bacterium]|nr:hypothetical protein [Flavobacteriales bacterium]